MSYGRRGNAAESREGRRQHDFVRASAMRQLFPQLAELHVEIEFDDGTDWAPSAQSFAYFPAARGFFRYPCPCHACDGEFDLTETVARSAGNTRQSRTVRLDLRCQGRRIRENQPQPCEMKAHVRIRALAAPPGSER
jgi:hypothetical protein